LDAVDSEAERYDHEDGVVEVHLLANLIQEDVAVQANVDPEPAHGFLGVYYISQRY